MGRTFQDKKIIFGICGGIAAYKVVDWIRELRREGAEVTVVMTKAATRFIAPLTLAALSGNRVHLDMFDEDDAENIPHITLARESDLIVVAPATAQTIARLAHGMADDLLAAVILAARTKVVLFPAMNSAMYLHSATQRNMETCRDLGYEIVEPESGKMACDEEGPGRLPAWSLARDRLEACFASRDLAGQTVLVTAGPTREPLDAARLLTNRSSGKMGYALAKTAVRRGAKVILLSGPTALTAPTGVSVIQVSTALEMRQAAMEHAGEATVIVMAAAVCDFRVEDPAPHKIKKTSASLDLKLVPNPDILHELGERKRKEASFPLLVGFAAETDNHEKEGWRKLREKNADLIAVNDISSCETGFEADRNRVVLLDRTGGTEHLPLLSKMETADRIWDKVARLL